METILLSLILAIGLAVLYFQIKNRPKQEENVGEKIKNRGFFIFKIIHGLVNRTIDPKLKSKRVMTDERRMKKRRKYVTPDNKAKSS